MKKETKELVFKKENGYTGIKADKQKKIFEFAKNYKKFLDAARTDRETIDRLVEMAEKHGYVNINGAKKNSRQKAPAKFYVINRNKSMAIVNTGRRPLTDGAHVLLSHVDSPRIDIKAMPLYEDGGLGFFKTHYYGGIKKFQWISSPMSLHGVVVLKGGKKVKINIGDSLNEPAFMLPDLAIHVSGKLQGDRKYNEVIKGEELNLLVGSIPAESASDAKDVKDKVKLHILQILNNKYGITEKDLISAELSAVPVARTQDIGFDASLIAGYGHDDRACVYTTALAAFQAEKPEYTTIAYFLDREEINSAGNTSATSLFISDVYEHILSFEGESGLYHKLRKAQSNSKAISADTTEAYNPTWKSVFDTNNVAHVNCGVTICKFTGAGGKRESSEASSEFMAALIELFDKSSICWQAGELGKVDEGGGNTVARYLASYNMDVIDIGPACMSLHSPTELISKYDLYSSYEAYCAFVNFKGEFKL